MYIAYRPNWAHYSSPSILVRMIVRHTLQLVLVLLLGASITATSSTLLSPDVPAAPYVVLLPPPVQSHTAAVITAVPDIIATSTVTPPETPHATTTHTRTASPKKVVTKTATPKVPPAKPAPAALSDTAYTTEVVRLINQQTNTYRQANKRTLLTTDSALARNANAYSRTLLAGDFLSHTDTQGCDMTCRFTRDGYTDAASWGENLGVINFDTRPTAEYVAEYFMNAWKKSAGHKANLLSANYLNTGIGVALDTNSVYVTVQFAHPN